jgi:hypothetical protein
VTERDPEQTEDAADREVYRLTGDSSADLERIARASAAEQGIDYDARMAELRAQEMPLTDAAVVAALVRIERQQDLLMSLVRTMAATQGLNVDDESILAMHELWTGAPGAASELITEQLAGDPDDAVGGQPYRAGGDPDYPLASDMPTPLHPRAQQLADGEAHSAEVPQGFAQWWGSAALDEFLDDPASGSHRGRPQPPVTPPRPWQGNG